MPSPPARPGAPAPAPGIEAVRAYWDWYIDHTEVEGEALGSRRFFEVVQKGHERAYGCLNDLLERDLRGRSLLELGCGIGLDTVAFAGRGAAVTAVDVSPHALDLARRNLEHHEVKADLQLGEAEQLEFSSESFDLVIARGLLMFTPSEERVVEEIHRVLKPGGEVQLLFHNRNSWYVLLARLTGTPLVHPGGDPPINRLYSSARARALLHHFRHVEFSFGRFPMDTQRGGLLGRIFNGAVVPLFRVIPRSTYERLGYYLIARAVK